VTLAKADLDRFKTVFLSVIDNPTIVFDKSLKLGEADGWDSFAQINLIIAIESSFDVEFDSDEISELVSVEKISNSLADKLKQTR
jgi:acyl carrier protein